MLSFFTMGLFSRKRTDVASVAISAVTDTPNIGKDSVLLSVLTEGDISADLINNYANGLGLKMRHLQLWADLNYIYGLPSASVANVRATDVRVRNIIATELGLADIDITVLSNIHGTVDTDSLAYEFMQKQRGWDFADNIVEQPPFVQGTTYVQFLSSYIKTGGQLLVIVYEHGNTTKEEEVFVAGLTSDDVYYHASYTKKGDPTTYYWNYAVATGTHPTLAVTHNTLQADNPYFPIVPFRINNVDQAKDTNSEAYKSTRQLLKLIGMDFGKMSESIHENPDIGEVDQAFLYVAVPLMSDEPNTIMYLQAYFADLEKISATKKVNFDAWKAAANNTAPPAVNTLHIKDTTFNLDFSYTYIDTVIVATDRYTVGEGARKYDVRERGSKSVEYTSGRNDTTRTRELFSYDQSTITFEHQVSKGVLHVTTIHGLYIENHIYGKHSVEADLGNAVTDKSTFLVPVNVNVVNEMSIKDGDRLYYDAMWLVFNSYKVTKLKWYETKLFKVIIQIVAIIITIYSLGSMAELAVAAATIGQAAIDVMVQLVIQYAISTAVDFLMKEIGLEAAIVLAAAAAIYGVGGGGTQGAANSLLPFAEKVLQLVQVMVAEIMEDIEEAFEDIQDELEEFLSNQSDIDKEFEALERELAATADINYLDVIRLRPNIDLTESPSEFYHRAIHSGNIGIASLDAPRNYIETMLELPSNKLILGD